MFFLTGILLSKDFLVSCMSVSDSIKGSNLISTTYSRFSSSRPALYSSYHSQGDSLNIPRSDALSTIASLVCNNSASPVSCKVNTGTSIRGLMNQIRDLKPEAKDKIYNDDINKDTELAKKISSDFSTLAILIADVIQNLGVSSKRLYDLPGSSSSESGTSIYLSTRPITGIMREGAELSAKYSTILTLLEKLTADFKDVNTTPEMFFADLNALLDEAIVVPNEKESVTVATKLMVGELISLSFSPSSTSSVIRNYSYGSSLSSPIGLGSRRTYMTTSSSIPSGGYYSRYLKTTSN